MQCSLTYKNRSFSVSPCQVSGQNSILTNNFPLCARIFFHVCPLVFCQKGRGIIFIQEGILYHKSQSAFLVQVHESLSFQPKLFHFRWPYDMSEKKKSMQTLGTVCKKSSVLSHIQIWLLFHYFQFAMCSAVNIVGFVGAHVSTIYSHM